MKSMKIYGIHGLLEWHGTIHSNGIKMRVDFTNGSTTAYGVAPATFMTKDELTQNIIEHSDEFKSGRIKLVRTVVIEADKKEPVRPHAAAPAAKKVEEKKEEEVIASDVKEYPDVTKTQEALKVLADEYNVDITLLKSKADARQKASELNISFPNLK